MCPIRSSAEDTVLTPEEAFRACLGEVYRYRLAMHEQEPRVRAAIEAAQAERQRIENDSYELLFEPSMSREAFERRLLSLVNQDTARIWRLKTEAEFQLVAIYGLFTMAKALRALAQGDTLSAIQRALARFDKAAPDVDLLRHLHTHADAYIRGGGKNRDRLPSPDDLGAVAMTDSGLIYWVGGKLFNLSEIVAATEELGAAIAAHTRDEART